MKIFVGTGTGVIEGKQCVVTCHNVYDEKGNLLFEDITTLDGKPLDRELTDEEAMKLNWEAQIPGQVVEG